VSGARLALFVVAAVAAGAGAVALAGLLLEDGAKGGAGTKSETSAPTLAGAPAPRLSGRDPVSGESVSLSDFRDMPLVVTVWASWCQPCRRQAGPVRRFVDKHRQTGVLGIDVQDDAAAAKDFVTEAGWTLASIADPDGRLAARLGVADMPTTYFFTRDHRLAATAAGYASLAELEAGLAAAEAIS
jgi:thiol-disulfide isomerase/thioredoxin